MKTRQPVNRRLLLTIAGLICTLSSQAQTGAATSSVAIYGIADACLARADLGATSVKYLNSGCLYGSRWGLRGTEDLGGGLRAGFQLEAGITIDNGLQAQGGRAFGRKALVNLGGPWGSIEAGRDYAPAFYLVQPVDPMGLGIGTASSTIWTGAASTGAARNDNVINLLSPTWNGVSVRVQAAAGEGGTTARKAMGALVMYRSAATIAGVSHTRVANANDSADDSATTVGVRQDFGSFSLAALAQSGSWKGTRAVAAPGSASALFSRSYRSFLIGGSLPVTATSVASISLKRYDDRTASNFDATQLSVNYVYSLSKRTDLYAGYSRLKNERASRYEISDATAAYSSVSIGATTSLLATGIKHVF